MVRLLISTGEVSGDLQGSLLIRALRLEAERRGLELEVLALGGPRMEAAGALQQARSQSLLPAAEHFCRFLEASTGQGRRGPMPVQGR